MTNNTRDANTTSDERERQHTETQTTDRQQSDQRADPQTEQQADHQATSDREPEMGQGRDEPARQEDPGHAPHEMQGDDADGEAEFATVEETTVDRDEHGDIIPEVVEVEELGPQGESRKVKVKPLNKSSHKKYLQPILEGDDLSDRKLAGLFDSHIVKPDLSQHRRCRDRGRVTKEFVDEELTRSQEDGYFIAILLGSGEHDVVELMRASRRGEVSPEQVEQANADDGGN